MTVHRLAPTTKSTGITYRMSFDRARKNCDALSHKAAALEGIAAERSLKGDSDGARVMWHAAEELHEMRREIEALIRGE